MAGRELVDQLFRRVGRVSALGIAIEADDGNLTLSIGSGATGFFSDTTHTDAVKASDYITFKQVTGATGTNITLGYMSVQAVMPPSKDAIWFGETF